MSPNITKYCEVIAAMISGTEMIGKIHAGGSIQCSRLTMITLEVMIQSHD